MRKHIMIKAYRVQTHNKVFYIAADSLKQAVSRAKRLTNETFYINRSWVESLRELTPVSEDNTIFIG